MAGRGVNKVIIVGNLGKDPEVKYLPSGECVVNISVATSEVWKDKQSGEMKEQTEWHRISAFGKLAEIMSEYLRKGSKVYIEGSLRTRSYQKDGQTHYTTEIRCDEMQMLDGNKSENGSPKREPKEKPAQNQGSLDSGFDEFSDAPF